MRFGNCVSEIQIQLKPVGGFPIMNSVILGNCKDLCVIINVTGSVCTWDGPFVSALALKEICYPHWIFNN